MNNFQIKALEIMARLGADKTVEGKLLATLVANICPVACGSDAGCYYCEDSLAVVRAYIEERG